MNRITKRLSTIKSDSNKGYFHNYERKTIFLYLVIDHKETSSNSTALTYQKIAMLSDDILLYKPLSLISKIFSNNI